jgi:hypothetical protein
MSFKVITHGFFELEEALTKVVIEVDPVLSKSLRALAEPVKMQAQASARDWPGGARSAAGIRIRRRQLNVRVEQGLSKTTGQHGNYGGVQMRHFFEPALEGHKAGIEEGVEIVIGRLVDI